jgi:5-methylcytosine-specific restriction endonuclease McrA
MSSKYCLVCRRSLDKSMYADHFCSRKCHSAHSYNLYVAMWLRGEESGGGPGRISKKVRRWLFSKRGRCCECCGWNKQHSRSGKIPLEINHINGNPNDHRPENLEILCPNCHSLTDHHGSLNYGNGRKLGVSDKPINE